MILEIRVNNFLVYANSVSYSLKADMHIKKFCFNVHNEVGFNILKTSCIYGGNNVGKTCMIHAIRSIKRVLLKESTEVTTNIFNDSKVCSLGITFLYEGHIYEYDFKYDSSIENSVKKGFVFEKLNEIYVGKSNNIMTRSIFIRDSENDIYNFEGNKELSAVLPLISNDNILIYAINSEKYKDIAEIRNIFIKFANKIEVLDMNNIPIDKTIEVMKNNMGIKDKTIKLIKLADLDIDDYLYMESYLDRKYEMKNIKEYPQEEVLKSVRLLDDMNRLISVHKGKYVRSINFDSTGTKKIVALASYIVEALEEGKILVVDELDSSLHFSLTKAIVALFNNEANEKAQLIFTVQDVSLLDCKYLFRKDQIWFASKEAKGAELISLKEYTAAKDNLRSDCDLEERYKKGDIAGILEPDLIDVLLGADAVDKNK